MAYLLYEEVMSVWLYDMLNRKGLVALTENQQVGWRLVKVENCNNKNYQRHTLPNLILLFNKTYSFTGNFDFEQHWLDP